MDQDLNILGEIHIDGTVDTTHLWPYHLEVTSDGSALLGGWIYDLQTFLPARAWIAKLSTFNTVEESRDPQMNVQVYPNPGATFTVSMNGSVVQSSRVDLYDLHGRILRSAPMNVNLAQVDGTTLPAGVYVYRIVDQHGLVRATGKWIRE